MRWFLPLMVVLLASPLARAEDEADLAAAGVVRAELKLEPKDPYVGQRAKLSLVLKTSRFFKGAPTFRLPDPKGAIVRQESAFAINGSESIDGETFATQQWDLDIYPQIDRPIEIPAIEVTMQVAGESTETVAAKATTKAVTLEPKLPEGIASGRYVISAKGFTMEATLDPADGKGLRVGDALVRSITMTVEDAPGMLIAPLPPFERVGLRAYSDEPLVEDKSERGTLRGTRVERTSYAFEREGTYELPGYEVQWFDLGAGELKTASVPAVTVHVTPSAVFDSGTSATGEDTARGTAEDRPAQQWLVGLAALLAVLAAGFVAWRRLAPVLAAKRAAARAAYEASEPAAFARLEAACEANDPVRAMNMLLAWVDARAAPSTGSLADLAQEEAAFAEALSDLDAHLYAEPRAEGRWRGAKLAQAAGALRASLDADASRAARDPLPPLNPRAT